MTDGSELGDVYGATIQLIKAQAGDKPRLGMAALMWISHAERPLQADELCHALAVKLGSMDFNARNVPLISTLVSCCQGLITVDKEASTVRLIHFTLQEYLSAHPNVFSRPHAAMADICLTYLNSRQIRAISNAPFEDEWRTSFLEYCSVYWGVHARREPSDSTRSLRVELLNENYDRIPTKLLLDKVPHLYLRYSDDSSPFSGPHCASSLGIIEVLATLIEMECYDINEGDFLGYTPLTWAAHNGHEEVVRFLLRPEEVNPDKPDKRGQTPLSYAAKGGYEGVVKLLLGREEANPDRPDGRCKLLFGSEGSRTPLSYTARGGYEGVVKILLEREEVDPGRPDNDGKTPLSFATGNRCYRVADLLKSHRAVTPQHDLRPHKKYASLLQSLPLALFPPEHYSLYDK